MTLASLSEDIKVVCGAFSLDNLAKHSVHSNLSINLIMPLIKNSHQLIYNLFYELSHFN